MAAKTTKNNSNSARNLGTSIPYFSGSEEYSYYECGICGVHWGLTADYVKARRDDKKGWLCPNGHSWVFNGETDEEKLRRQLKNEQEWAARLSADLEQTKASLRGTKGVVTRMKNRAAAGVCPCCNRTFQQLARHMASKHPEFKDDPKS